MSESKLWAKTFECLIAEYGVFEALKFGKLKRLQITQRFDDCLQNENSR